MEVIIANITSYIGISSDAEHYYCKYEKVNTVELLDRLYNYHRLSVYGSNELKYYPTQEEALMLVRKDNYGRSTDTDEYKATWYMEDGTIRFPSAHAITNELHKKFPDANIIIAVDDSINSYKSLMLHEEYYILFDELSPEKQNKIIKFFSGNDFDRYNTAARRHYFLCKIFSNKLEEKFVAIAKLLINNENIDDIKK